ncbi:MAG TPA: PAS domain-containing sensor histidine kinase [Hyphomicrobiales bacterium]|nr:PAS domain-containing sensor histidine kinase [Hyphomicrobiales bacterium]
MSGPSHHPRIVEAAAGTAPAFAVSGDGGMLVWANAAAAGLIGIAPAELPQPLATDDAAERRGRTLAGLPADGGPRLVRLALPGRSGAPAACRAERLTLDGGELVLVTVLGAITAEPEAPVAADRPAADHPAPDEPAADVFQPMPLPLRLVWECDREGRIRSLTPDLGAALGSPTLPLIGRRWSDLAPADGDSPGRLAAVLDGRDTWSGFAVLVPLGDGRVVRAELSALPMVGRDRSFLGFRGFAVVREPPRPPPTTVVPLREPARDRRPRLLPDEATALNEIARALGNDDDAPAAPAAAPPAPLPDLAGRLNLTPHANVLDVLDALPSALVIHRLGQPLFANRALLDLARLPDLAALRDRGVDGLLEHGGGPGALALVTADGTKVPVEAHLKTVTWDGAAASLLTLRPALAAPPDPAAEERLEAAEQRARELQAILDTAADGVVVVDGDGRILSLNKSAEALFGYDSEEMEGRSFALLFASESQRPALDYLAGLRTNGVAAVMNDGREVLGVVRRGGMVPLFMTLGRVGEAAAPRFCAVLRDLTQFKRAEEDLRTTRAEAERTSAYKSAFLARISHEIRTPLNAMLGFAELMIEERFGPIGNPRYRDYLRDILSSGRHVIGLVDDLLDLSKVEAGKLDLVFVEVSLNEVVAGAVALLQPEANRGRIIIRTSLAPKVPAVMADLRSLKQIVMNLLSNAVTFTPPGGQVIVSTAPGDRGEAVIRIRDTGAGMSAGEIETALEPFGRVSATARGTGLGLPLTKALVEANRAAFAIHSTVGSGTLVEVIFPPTRVVAE